MFDLRAQGLPGPVDADALLPMACRLGRLESWRLDAGSGGFRAAGGLAALHSLPTVGGVLAMKPLLERYAADERAQLSAALRNCADSGVPFELSLALGIAGASRRWLHWSGQRVADGRVVGLVRDDSASWRDRQRQAMEHALLADLASGRSLADVLEAVALRIESDFCGAKVQILRIDVSDGRLHHLAGARLPEAFRQQVDGLALAEAAAFPVAGGAGSDARVTDDIARAPEWEALSARALEHGLRACWAWPATGRDGQPLAVLALYFEHGCRPDAESADSLRSAAALIAIGIGQLDLLENVRQLMDSAVEVICIIDEAGRFVAVNRAALDTWGYPEAALIGQRLDCLVHPDDIASTYAAMGVVTRGTPVRDFHNRNVAKDGRIIEMRWSASWSPDSRRLYCYGRDVTAQRQTDDQMRLLQRAMDSSRNGVLICDARAADMPIIYVNSAMERITGYAREEYLGRNCRFLQGEDRNQPELRRLRRALARGTECKVVLRNYRKDGSPFWNELFIAPVRDASGFASHFLGVIIDVSERQRFEQELARAVSHDAVTDLPRYASLAHDRQQALGRAAGTEAPRWWLLFIDLDRFHAVNESLGDRIGDLALREIARRLRETLGEHGQLSRFAGDEFVAMVSDLDEPHVLALADSLRRAVGSPLNALPFDLQISVSIGISGSPQHGREPGELLRRAEAAMNQAKREGRDAVCLYSESSMREFEDRMALGLHLRGAVERDELDVHFQPQIGAEDGRLLGFEALVRWTRSPLGSVPPGRFIPVAEALGLMPEVGRRVLQRACRQLRAWRDAGLQPPVLAVNVSALQLLRADFADEVAQLLAEHGVPAGELQIELTESLLMENVQRVRGTLDRLRELGVSLALDDFGTGYSSLAYLKRFAFDKLKIDRSFVADLSAEGNDAAIARTIITIGHQLGMRVSAEGVETPAQLRVLRELGCDELQGYLLGRPQPASDLAALLASGLVALPSA